MKDESIGLHLDKHASEFLEGYVIVGYVAGKASPVVFSKADDAKTALALNALLMDLVARGGVCVTK